MAEDEHLLKRGAAEVQEAVFEAEFLVRLGALHLEGRRRRGVEDFQFSRAHFDRAGFEVRVLLAGQAGATVPFMPTTYSLDSRAAACRFCTGLGSKTT